MIEELGMLQQIVVATDDARGVPSLFNIVKTVVEDLSDEQRDD